MGMARGSSCYGNGTCDVVNGSALGYQGFPLERWLDRCAINAVNSSIQLIILILHRGHKPWYLRL